MLAGNALTPDRQSMREMSNVKKYRFPSRALIVRIGLSIQSLLLMSVYLGFSVGSFFCQYQKETERVFLCAQYF